MWDEILESVCVCVLVCACVFMHLLGYPAEASCISRKSPLCNFKVTACSVQAIHDTVTGRTHVFMEPGHTAVHIMSYTYSVLLSRISFQQVFLPSYMGGQQRNLSGPGQKKQTCMPCVLHTTWNWNNHALKTAVENLTVFIALWLCISVLPENFWTNTIWERIRWTKETATESG